MEIFSTVLNHYLWFKLKIQTMQASVSPTFSVIPSGVFWDVLILSSGGTLLTTIDGFGTQEKAYSCIEDLTARCHPIKNDIAPTSQRPPYGIRPKWLIMEERAEELQAAIMRYIDSGLPVPNEWISERIELVNALKKPHA